MNQPLSLCEKILLLSVRPGKGGYFFATRRGLDFAVAGALILDLVLAGNLRFADGRLVVISVQADSPAGNYLMERLAKVPKPKTAGFWLKSILLSKRTIRKLVLRQLIASREVRLETRHFLFFSWSIVFLRSGNQTARIISEIRHILMRGNGTDQQISLISLLLPSRLLGRIYPERYERRQARKRIKENGEVNRSSLPLRNLLQVANSVASSVISSTYSRS